MLPLSHGLKACWSKLSNALVGISSGVYGLLLAECWSGLSARSEYGFMAVGSRVFEWWRIDWRWQRPYDPLLCWVLHTAESRAKMLCQIWMSIQLPACFERLNDELLVDGCDYRTKSLQLCKDRGTELRCRVVDATRRLIACVTSEFGFSFYVLEFFWLMEVWWMLVMIGPSLCSYASIEAPSWDVELWIQRRGWGHVSDLDVDSAVCVWWLD